MGEPSVPTRDEIPTAEVATKHRMVPGSHERPGGAECRCGRPWDRWNDRCTSDSPTVPTQGWRSSSPAAHITRTRVNGLITSSCNICQESVDFPDCVMWSAVLVEWESNHQHPNDPADD